MVHKENEDKEGLKENVTFLASESDHESVVSISSDSDDESEVSNIDMFQAACMAGVDFKGVNLKDCILLDNQSTVHAFYNK